MSGSRFRHYCFTLNNWSDTALVDSIQCTYIVYGKEFAPTTETPHLQGFITFKEAKTLSSAIKLLPGCHVTSMYSTVEACIAYCKEDGNFVERGIQPKSLGAHNVKQKEDWAAILQAAKDRRNDDIPDNIRFKFCRNIDYIADQEDRVRVHQANPVLDNEWIWGSTGTGKTTKAVSENIGHYKKMCNKWWDGYLGEEVVLIDEFNLEQAKYLAHHLKIWADHEPFRAEKKGGSIVIRPKRIIVTSNYSIEQCFGEDTSGSLEPLKRRFKEICLDNKKDYSIFH